jgi:hypothetical protein
MRKGLAMKLGACLMAFVIDATLQASVSYSNLSCPTNGSYEGTVDISWSYSSSTYSSLIWADSCLPSNCDGPSYSGAWFSEGQYSGSGTADWLTYGYEYAFEFYYAGDSYSDTCLDGDYIYYPCTHTNGQNQLVWAPEPYGAVGFQC